MIGLNVQAVRDLYLERDPRRRTCVHSFGFDEWGHPDPVSAAGVLAGGEDGTEEERTRKQDT
jgi:hypothetical protein